MNRPGVVILLVALWIGSGMSTVHAQPLMCQARVAGTSGGPVPITVSFQALVAGGELPLAFHWDFGDGTTSLEADPLHVYTQVGVYDAVLTVTPSGGTEACRDTAVIPVAIFIDPLCWASADVTWSTGSSPISFTAGLGLLPDPPPYEWVWWFGDGTTRSIVTSIPFQLPWEHGYADPGTYWAAVSLRTSFGMYPCLPTVRVTTLVPQGPVTVDPSSTIMRLQLEPARPNPFATKTQLDYALPRAGWVSLVILDLQGRRVATLANGVQGAGRHSVSWYGHSHTGHTVPAGIYMAVLEQEGATHRTRIVRLP